MPEEISKEERIPTSSKGYSEIISAIDENPYDPKVWERVLSLARDEEGTDRAREGFYGHIPLDEMIKTAERLKGTANLDDKYRILAEKCSTGELWYDIILGHTNDQNLVVLGEEIGNWRNLYGRKTMERKWDNGLDIGSGTGNSLLEIKKHAGKFIGVEKLEFLSEAARSNPELSEAKIVTADALNLPFPDEEFDLVMSNGLTSYLPKKELPKFVKEVARVVEPGGSYFEPFIIKRKEEVLPLVEKEFLKNGKGVLVCLMDRMITNKGGEETVTEESHFSILKSAFEKNGFSYKLLPHQNKGIAVAEFKKRLPPDFEDLKSLYVSSGAFLSYGQMINLLFNDSNFHKNELKEIIEEGKLPSSEKIIPSLKFFKKLAADQWVIMSNSYGHYNTVFIRPLAEISIDESVEPAVRQKAQEVLVANLERFYQDTPDREGKEFYHYLGKLREQIENKTGCEKIISQIDTIIAEISLKKKTL